MPILDQHTPSQITDLIEACARYWELRGVAKKQRDEMQLELEQHLTQAVRDGKPLQAVIGSNPPAFAEAWAREMHPRVRSGGIILLPTLVYALSVVSTTAFIQQVLAHTLTFTFTLFAAYLLTSSGLLALLIPLSGFLAPRIRTRRSRVVLLCALGVLAALILREVGIRVNWSLALFSWSWPLTLMLFALAAFLFFLDYWRTASQRASSASRVPLGRSLLTFVGSVAMFDVLLFVGSIVVFNFCLFAGRLM